MLGDGEPVGPGGVGEEAGLGRPEGRVAVVLHPGEGTAVPPEGGGVAQILLKAQAEENFIVPNLLPHLPSAPAEPGREAQAAGGLVDLLPEGGGQKVFGAQQ